MYVISAHLFELVCTLKQKTVILGRYSFFIFHDFLSPPVVKNSGRADLFAHDLYNFSVGLVVEWFLFVGIERLYLFLVWWRLSVVTRVRVSGDASGTEDHQFDVVYNEESRPGQQMGRRRTLAQFEHYSRVLRLWWFEQGRALAKKVLKVIYISSWVGILFPLLFGILFDLYVVIPFRDAQPSPDFSWSKIATNWVYGVMLTRMLFILVWHGPETEMRRVIRDAEGRGVAGIQNWEFTKVIVWPLAGVGGLFFLVPILFANVLFGAFFLEGWYCCVSSSKLT